MKVIIEKLDHFGRGITRIDNKICFVENALPNEEVEIEITKENKKYIEAKAIKIIKESNNRKEILCPYYEVCGGCDLLHLSFIEENKYKHNKIVELLKKYGKIKNIKVEDICYDSEYFYRNKIILHGSNQRMGYFKKKTNELIPIKECLLMDKRINKLLPVLENISKNSDIKDIVIRISNDGSLLMLKLIGKIHDVKSLDNLVDILFINDEKIFGSDKMISNIGNKKYYVSIDSFFQVNKTLTEQLYNYVLNIVKEAKPKKLLDLYCGSGTIGIYVSDYADQIIGVELLRSSISDANENKKLNGVKNISFICNKVENVIDTFQNDVDLIIVDPPRAGLDKNTIVNIKRINPEKIIYISCDPVTMCRDIDFLSDKYDLVSVKPFNMFPRTYHVESVSILHRI